MEPVSLYLHIPFCQYRCTYCDFNTYTSLGDLKDAYADALIAEIGQAAGGVRRPAQTIFFGGGTPSLMPAEGIGRILDAVRAHFELLSGAEVTMEANPETVDDRYLAAVRGRGINRISFGAQSAIAGELALLGREHTFATVVDAVAAARRAGLTNLSLDLIYGVPGQTLAGWRESLEAALALDPPHLSLYCLTIEPGTPLHRSLQTGQIRPPDPDFAADQYALAGEMLAAAGYVHYEISNWARPGHQSRHNLAYWYNEEYLGLGAGAHGHAGGVRYHVVKQPRSYIRRLAVGELPAAGWPLTSAAAGHQALTEEEEMADTIIMGLRLVDEGIDTEAFYRRFGRRVADLHGETIAELVGWGLLAWDPAGRVLRLTRDGCFVSNQVFHRFL